MLNTLTITAAHDKLRSKEISSTELVQACLDQIDQCDEQVSAVVYDNRESALNLAKSIDGKGVFDHALTGIPYMVKDVYCEVGVPTTACSNILRNKDYRPPYESTTTARLKDCGAVSLGKVNTDEFTMGASTETSCYGPTMNPWDLERIAGGSSGGSAACLAAHQALFSLGTDTGGSIRQPAAFCNLAGIRPTYGRTSRYGAMSMASSLDTTGPLAKTVEDLAIVLQAMAGYDTFDGTTVNTPVPNYRLALNEDLNGMRIGIPKEYFIDGLNADVAASITDAKKVLQSLGVEFVDISLPHTKYATPVYYVLAPCEISSNMARYDGIRYGHTEPTSADLVQYYFDTRSAGFGAEVKRRIMVGTYALSAGYYDAYYRQALKIRRLIKQDFDEAFEYVDAIISPCTPSPAFVKGAHEGDPVAMYLEDIFLDPQVLAGIPALSIPCGFARNERKPNNKLPLGLQIMGPQWSEERLLNIGHKFQTVTDWHTHVAPIS